MASGDIAAFWRILQIVILSEAKDLGQSRKILRFAQNDSLPCHQDVPLLVADSLHEVAAFA